MAGKDSDFHMEWTDVKNTSSASIFDSRGRFLSDPSGGLAAQCVMETSTVQIFVPFHSHGTLPLPLSFFFLSLNGVVAKDHGLNICFWHSRY